MKIFLFCYLRAHLAPLNHAESHIYYLSFKLPLLASELCHSLSDELASGSENFGGGLSFDLFDGLWELRVAFHGFSWEKAQIEVPIAFPAVRGEICVEENDGDDDNRGGAMKCQTWVRLLNHGRFSSDCANIRQCNAHPLSSWHDGNIDCP